MKKCLTIVLSLIVLFIAGCTNNSTGQSDEISPNNQGEESTAIICFPEYAQGKNLEVKISLPEGWQMEIRTSAPGDWPKYPLMDLASVINIYNEENENIGAIGYAAYTEYEGAEELPQAIYSGIAVPNNYNFSAIPVEDDGYYIPVKVTDNGVNAITKVYYSPIISKDVGYGEEERYNKGILAYNKDLLVYIAIEFDNASISDETLRALSESILIRESKI